MKKLIVCYILLFALLAAAQNPYRIHYSFNAGELSELLTVREDLSKYQTGCSQAENVMVMPQGALQKRSGTKYVAESKENTKIRLFPFEYDVDNAYVVEAGNQYFRFYTDQDQITVGEGYEDETTLDDSSDLLAHWNLNDNLTDTTVTELLNLYGGTSDTNTENIHWNGKVGTGSFDFDAEHYVTISDDDVFTFAEDHDFSLAGWIYVEDTGTNQTIVSKWDEGTGREWRMYLTSEEKLRLELFDNSLDNESDCISQWKLNDTDADTVVDDSQAAHNGTASDNCDTLTTTGKINDAFDLNGTDEKVTVSNHADFDFGDGSSDSAFSVCAWVNMDDAWGGFPIFCRTKVGTPDEYAFWVSTSGWLRFILFDGDQNNYIGRRSSTVLTAYVDQWIHVAATYDGTGATSGIDLYLNGEVVDNYDLTGGAYTAMHGGDANVEIGFAPQTEGSTTARWADGTIDDVRIYGTELSQTEIQAIYAGGVGTETFPADSVYSTSDDALSTGWRFVAATYNDDDGGNDAADSIALYVDGSAVDVTAYNYTNYVAMENTGADVMIGATLDSDDNALYVCSSALDNISIYEDDLTSVQVAALYNGSQPLETETPYLTADLYDLHFIQSADVMYITHPDYEPRELKRYHGEFFVLDAANFDTGPFRTQNDDENAKISASATTGNVTLTATGCNPFVDGTTAGHEPSGSTSTDKCTIGALFKLVHPISELEYHTDFTADFAASEAENASWLDCGILYEGATWTLETGGTWYGDIHVYRNYSDLGSPTLDDNPDDDAIDSDWELVFEFNSGGGDVDNARNVSTTGTENDGDARYIVFYYDDQGADPDVHFWTDQTEHAGIVKITEVTSTTEATGTVIRTLASTDATHKWSEGAWSNYRGWPRTTAFFEDRLFFGGNDGQPDTVWGSATSDYDDFLAGANDDESVAFTLSSRQVNTIQWMTGKDKLLIGTAGDEWSLGGSADEPLTPSNVRASQQSTYGSVNIQAAQVSESVLFFQRGAEKMRELAYNWEEDSYVAPDMTILNPEITGDGITNIGYQQTPESILWCVREDGNMPVFAYERKEQITAWSELITDGDFESVAVISGDPENEVWVSVERDIDGSTVRYIEYFETRDWGSDNDDAFFVDCGITYDSTATTTITGLGHLEGEEVLVWADGVQLGNETVASGQITIDSSSSTVQVGLPYTVQVKTMPLSYMGEGMTIQGRIKRIGEVISRHYESGDYYVGRDTTDKELVSISGIESDFSDQITFPSGYDRVGYCFIYQQSPEPLTLVSLMLEFEVE